MKKRETIGGLIKSTPHNHNYQELYNRISNLGGVFVFKGYVQTFEDLEKEFPNEDASTAVFVAEDKIIYRHDGEEWKAVVDLSDFQTIVDKGTILIDEMEDVNQEVKSNESERVAEESIRVNNEFDRIENENIRINNEDIRQSNEQIRIENDESRNETFDEKLKDLEDTDTVKFHERVSELEFVTDDHEERIEIMEESGVPISDSARKLSEPRSIELTGGVSGSVQFDGSEDVEINVNVNSREHIHDDRYYTEDEIDDKLLNKSDEGHTHDNRYYTEEEIDTKLDSKSNSSHNHDGTYLNETSNLSDLRNVATARNNLGLGTIATRDVFIQSSTPTYRAGAIWIKI